MKPQCGKSEGAGLAGGRAQGLGWKWRQECQRVEPLQSWGNGRVGAAMGGQSSARYSKRGVLMGEDSTDAIYSTLLHLPAPKFYCHLELWSWESTLESRICPMWLSGRGVLAGSNYTSTHIWETAPQLWNSSAWSCWRRDSLLLSES